MLLDILVSPAFEFRGAGFLGGLNPTSPEGPDGLARILNAPAVVKVRVLESRSLRLITGVTSNPDGTWRIDHLALDRPFTVIGIDGAGRVNSAIQDWVYAAPMVVSPPVLVPRLELVFPPARPGVPWRGKVLLHDAAEAWTTPVIAGVPPWMTADVYPDGMVLRGMPDTDGEVVIGVSAMVGDYPVSGNGTLVVSSMVRAFRLLITANAGNASFVTINELQPRSAASSPVGVSGVVSFSSQFDAAANAAANLFDGDPNTRWATRAPTQAEPEWIAYEFSAPVALAKLAIMSSDASRPSRTPRDFHIELQHMDGTWDTAATYSGVPEWAPLTWQEFAV